MLIVLYYRFSFIKEASFYIIQLKPKDWLFNSCVICTNLKQIVLTPVM